MKPLARAASAIALGTLTTLAMSNPAWATSDIGINPGNVPTKAADAEQSCDANFGGGPYTGRDVWVFNLPGQHKDTGDFRTVVASFDTDGDGKADTSVTIEEGASDGDDIVLKGTSKAWVVTDAGWTLVGATATITGTADKFVLTHTCAGRGGGSTPTPTPGGDQPSEPAQPPSGTPSATPSATPTGTPSDTPPATSPGTPSATPSGAGGGDSGGGLPVTGTAIGGILLLGVGLVGTGAVLLTVRRRRGLTDLTH